MYCIQFEMCKQAHNYVVLSQLLILKNLHHSTLQHMNMVAELFPDSVSRNLVHVFCWHVVVCMCVHENLG